MAENLTVFPISDDSSERCDRLEFVRSSDLGHLTSMAEAATISTPTYENAAVDMDILKSLDSRLKREATSS